jgi:hypothetical protein
LGGRRDDFVVDVDTRDVSSATLGYARRNVSDAASDVREASGVERAGLREKQLRRGPEQPSDELQPVPRRGTGLDHIGGVTCTGRRHRRSLGRVAGTRTSRLHNDLGVYEREMRRIG